MGKAKNDILQGTLALLVLKTLQAGPIHGWGITLHIQRISHEVLRVEEGVLYPTLQKMLLKGWVTAEWGISETNRKVHFYSLTPAGRKQLQKELSDYDRVTAAIQNVLRTA